MILDVLATDSTGRQYDIEMQRADKGASPRRARYNSSLIDGHILIAGEEYENLPETYVIFITENDVFGKGMAMYRIERVVTGTGDSFEDGSHILYVDSSHLDESRIGRLMHDFRCTEPDEMHYAVLADRARYFKKDMKGVSHMCKIMEEVKAEGYEEGMAEGYEEGMAQERERAIARALENARRKATEMLRDGVLSREKIAEYTDLPIAEVDALAAAM